MGKTHVLSTKTPQILCPAILLQHRNFFTLLYLNGLTRYSLVRVELNFYISSKYTGDRIQDTLFVQEKNGRICDQFSELHDSVLGKICLVCELFLYPAVLYPVSSVKLAL